METLGVENYLLDIQARMFLFKIYFWEGKTTKRLFFFLRTMVVDVVWKNSILNCKPEKVERKSFHKLLCVLLKAYELLLQIHPPHHKKIVIPKDFSNLFLYHSSVDVCGWMEISWEKTCLKTVHFYLAVLHLRDFR